MSNLLTSIKADLLDRRLLPLVALVAVALIAAIAYAAMGGSGSPSTPAVTANANPAVQATAGLQVSTSVADKSVAETTDGVKDQRSGKAHDPFTPLAGAAGTSTSTSSTSTSSSSSSTSSSGSSEGSSKSGGSSGSETTKTETSKKTKTKPKPSFHVAVLFGLFPAGATPETVTLTPYENLKLQAPLPSIKQPLIVFRGVTVGGKSATFTLIGEAILHGNGNCLPNASQCEAIDLKPGQSEQLDYLKANGEASTYELRVVSITAASASASTASVKSGWAESKAGQELLRHRGLLSVPFLRYSSRPGVLVFAAHKAFGARAHDAKQPRRGRR